MKYIDLREREGGEIQQEGKEMSREGEINNVVMREIKGERESLFNPSHFSEL